jgi:hypothetical protein
MLKVVSTKTIPGEDLFGDVSLVYPPIYTIDCEDEAGNGFEIETNKNTYVQIKDFLDKIKEV